MNDKRRTQKARSEATRSALLQAARDSFGGRGYHATNTLELVAAASVTRGALYHHFADKESLFETLAREVATKVSVQATSAALKLEGSTWDRLIEGMREYLRLVAEDAAIQRILLIDGPAVLGWQRWRDIQTEVVLPGTMLGLRMLMQNEQLHDQDPEPLAHLVLAALNDAALMVAHAETPESARQSVTNALMNLLAGLAPKDPCPPNAL